MSPRHFISYRLRMSIDDEIAALFHSKFIGDKVTEQTMAIAKEYVKFVLDTYEDIYIALLDRN